MIPDKLLEVLRQDGVVAIATLGKDGPHMVNAWHSDVSISSDGRLLIPVGGMHHTEANIAYNPNVLITYRYLRSASPRRGEHRLQPQCADYSGKSTGCGLARGRRRFPDQGKGGSDHVRT
ncbi:MAG: pyridoxamine 5'-phosphate oxidase family protein [Candidatus Methylomirabilis sp.]|nr:pyridoxamine 5'-phosphate oxidase family protein [Candidatus Methylomirabilis sp.]